MYQISLIEIERGHTVVDPEAGSYFTGPDDFGPSLVVGCAGWVASDAKTQGQA